ncbi:MAG: PAS domain-containing protein, partial [Halothiobacillus sp.]|nr:PAS domain-containing protein [Halothiobacillus sp.]
MLPSMTNYADAWLWIKLDTKGNIHDQNVIIQTGELHDLALVLTTLSGLEAWAKTVGRHGPTEGTNGWVWRARWLEIQHLAPWLSPCANGAPTARLLHVSAYPRISEEAIGWLDRLPDFVIGRDENLSTVFLNKAAHDAHDGLLIEQLTRGAPEFDEAQPPAELHVLDRGDKPRIFQRRTIQAPPSAALNDFILAHEITAIKALEHALSDNERLMRTLIDATPDFIVIKDAQGHWLLANESALNFCHLQDIAWWGKTDEELAAATHPMYRATFARYGATDLRAWETRRLVRTMDTLPLPGGRTRVFDTLKLPLFEPDGRRKVLIIIGRDVTERQEAQEKYQSLANQDELTGLLSRRCFQLEAQRWIDELKREKSSQTLALVMFDLDYFRSVNDSYG